MQVVTDDAAAVSNSLAQIIGTQKYRIWFEGSTRLELSDDSLKVCVPNLFVANWIESHFAAELQKAQEHADCKKRKIVFAVDPELAGRRSPQKRAADPVKSDPKKYVAKSEHGKQDFSCTAARLSLDNFVVGSSNELAYNAASLVAKNNESLFNPLFIHGGYGVGKTHLLQGICNEVTRRRPQTDWLYLSAEDFANQFVLALKTKKLDAFRRRMRQTELLAIDDIHFLAGKLATQEEFLHTFNNIDLAGKQIVLVSDAHPKMIEDLSDKLVNRFVSGMVVRIDTPDIETRCEICRRYSARTNQRIPENVIEFVAQTVKTSVRELEGALVRLTAFASLQNQQITMHLAQDALADHLSRVEPVMHRSDIDSAVATYFAVSPADIHSAKRDRTVALARHFSMYLTRKHTSMSLPEIGRSIGNKNHATVLMACKKIEDNVGRNVQMKWTSREGNRTEKAQNILNAIEQAISA